MMKKVLVMCLMSAMCLTQTFAQNQVKSVPAQATETRASAFSGGAGTEADPYQISTAEDLVTLSSDVNKQISYKGEFFVLTQDIDMSAVENFLPIGNNHGKAMVQKCFMGNFDGCNYTIRGIKSSYEGIYYQGVGLFGMTMDNTIQNIRIEDCSFTADGMVAGIVAVPVGSTIKNCHVGKNVNITATVMGGAGVVASTMLEPSIITECTSYATVKVGVQFGCGAGIIASVSQGGDGTIISRCVNFGTVNVEADQASGILSFVDMRSIVEDCANFGTINSGVGGAGIAYFPTRPDNNLLTVNNCYNVAEITGGEPEKLDAVSLGNVYTGGGEGCFVSENCFYAEDTNGAKSRTAKPMMSADMKTQEFVDQLNNGRADGPWCIIEGVADGFPVPFAALVPSSIQEVETSAASISYNAGVVTVAGAKAGDKFAVVDMAGRTVKMAEAQNGEFTIDLSNVPAGVYVIGNGSISKKIVK